ncbi:unnamed protein product, partial [Polarella glacialis]
AITEEAFKAPWLVVVDGREGRLVAGDPVVVYRDGQLAEKNGVDEDIHTASWRGTVRARGEDSMYTVEDEAQALHQVSSGDLHVDSARVQKV